ncbi:MAG: dipicolinate synthase [Clostridia bacterium]|nr:dipicolinate synthase [Clostridia bacterium]
MEICTDIALLGGDARMLYCAGMLEETGSTVHLFGFENEPAVRRDCVSAEEAVARARVVLLPMPVSRDREHLLAPLARQPVELSDRLAELLQGRLVFCGMVQNLPETAAWKKLPVIDYYKDEELLAENARITAEAALFEAMKALPGTLYDARCLVAGFGRIGKALAAMLRGLGARVTVAARKPEDRVLARALGAETTPFTPQLPACEVVFNTVPQPVFTGAVPLPAETKLYIELASRPGLLPEGNTAGAEVIAAASLPGKYAPRAAGRAIAAVLQRCIHAERKEHP